MFQNYKWKICMFCYITSIPWKNRGYVHLHVCHGLNKESALNMYVMLAYMHSVEISCIYTCQFMSRFKPII